MLNEEKATSKKYIGIKIVKAYKQSKDGRDGYAVTYKDGYESWSPKEAFEESYKLLSEMDFN